MSRTPASAGAPRLRNKGNDTTVDDKETPRQCGTDRLDGVAHTLQVDQKFQTIVDDKLGCAIVRDGQRPASANRLGIGAGGTCNSSLTIGHAMSVVNVMDTMLYVIGFEWLWGHGRAALGHELARGRTGRKDCQEKGRKGLGHSLVRTTMSRSERRQRLH